MPRINLLYVITKLELGGAQKQLLVLISHLDKEKFRPILFTAREGLLLPDALAINELTLKKSKCLERPVNLFKDLLTLIELYRFIKKNNIQIVHTHSSKAGILGRWAARLAHTPVILHTVHGWSFNDYQPRMVRLFFVWLERLAARFTDRLIVVSNHDKQKGVHNHIGQQSKYVLIPYGIDYAQFAARGGGIRKELGLSACDLAVGMVSCFKPQKSPQDFIRLALLTKQITPEDKIKFILVGDGVLRASVERLIKEWNLEAQVVLTGWRRDIPEILSAIDIFVLTSLWEGLPITVLEAMASGKPIIATHTGGIAEAISEGESGFLVLRHDMRMAAQKLSVLLKDRSLRIRMGENARESLGQKFALSSMVSANEDIYAAMLKAKGVWHAN